MHKSGTTLISEILHKSGINMGVFDESVPYDKGNQYERKEVNVLNKELLDCGNEFSLKVTNLVRKENIEIKYLDEISEIIKKCDASYKNWGFKDPRMCLTYSVWRDFLPEHRLIVVYRNPVEVWRHYQPKKSSETESTFFRSWKIINAWYKYNSRIINYLGESKEKVILINYGNFMQDNKGFQHLEEFAGLKLVDSRKTELYRSKSKPSVAYCFWAWINHIFFSRDVNTLYGNFERLYREQA